MSASKDSVTITVDPDGDVRNIYITVQDAKDSSKTATAVINAIECDPI